MSEVQVFELAPSSPSVWPWLVGVVIVCVVVGALAFAGYVTRSCATARFEVGAGALRVVAGVYGRTIPLADLDLSGALVVDASADTPLRPRRRINGVGLPGLRGGWYRLADGQKALIFLTRAKKAAYVPTRLGFGLLLGVTDPEGLIAALRRASGG